MIFFTFCGTESGGELWSLWFLHTYVHGNLLTLKQVWGVNIRKQLNISTWHKQALICHSLEFWIWSSSKRHWLLLLSLFYKHIYPVWVRRKNESEIVISFDECHDESFCEVIYASALQWVKLCNDRSGLGGTIAALLNAYECLADSIWNYFLITCLFKVPLFAE